MPTSQANPKRTALVIGATSSLAQVLCRKLAERGYGLVLAARDERELELLAGDVSTRFDVPARTIHIDLTAANFSPTRMVENAGPFDTLIFAAGDMGTGEQDDLANIAQVAQVNFVVPAQILSVASEYLSDQGGGAIAVITSVAGDRGRQSNYEYGSAKAALASFASGLRNRYAKNHVHIMTAKPGFIDTPLTWGMHSPLIASREAVAECILRGLEKSKNVIYAPWFWRWIMLIIQHIPEALFKRMKL